MKTRRAFTLVELLVVIAIILIIAAILFPVFAQAREKARQIVCVSNMRQIGIAFQEYITDNNEGLPNAAAGGSDGVGAVGVWMFYTYYPADASHHNTFDPTKSCLYPYVKSARVFVCPDDPIGAISGDSYSYNSCLTSPNLQAVSKTGLLWPGKPLSTQQFPSNTMLLAEEGSTDPAASTDDGLMNFDDSPDGYNASSFSVRHSAGSNLLLLDSHVKWYPYDQLVDGNFETARGGDSCLN
jgi:prepilin-type N-terminal cleavage/methylation domain-containing protein